MTVENRTQQIALLFATFVIAICGLVYELLTGTLSSYLLGDSVYQFSLVIGLFMSSMGIGAWFSRFIENELPREFVRLQMLVGLLGGISAPLLFFAFAVLDSYTPILFIVVILLGAMLGIEIPLIIRILKEHFSLKTNLSNVFTADYIGALIAALLFPLVLVPQLGLMQTGFLIGLLNVAIGLLALHVFRPNLERTAVLYVTGAVLVVGLTAGLFTSDKLVKQMETRLYQDEVIYSEDTLYSQRLVLTRRGERIRFYINGALQFDSVDEYRYHESLTHPTMGLVRHPERLLILGGGDGMVARELLRYPEVQEITLVDLDPSVTKLFKDNALLRQFNDDALNNPKVEIVNQDAWKFLEQNQQPYDAVFIDLPDPNNASLSRLYSTVFYQLLKQHLTQYGVIVTQATSPLFSREAFWSIETTLGQNNTNPAVNEKWFTLPYHTYIPSFGEWGFVMAARQPLQVENIELLDTDYRYLNAQLLPQMFNFPNDMSKIDVESNHLTTHALLQYYEKGWAKWYE